MDNYRITGERVDVRHGHHLCCDVTSSDLKTLVSCIKPSMSASGTLQNGRQAVDNLNQICHNCYFNKDVYN